ncbi:YdcF family protein [Photobacterium kishitanii]|uniref:YdcF family protein n=1 Tax=Photobacterium kishitanii TaxID=318456 RepID=UPI0034E98BDC
MPILRVKWGVPNDCIYIEPLATNTGDNIIKTRELLHAKKLEPQRFILVQKPFMERRTLATFEKQWPNKAALVTSPPLMFDEFANDVISYGDVVNVMVGGSTTHSLLSGVRLCN